MELKCLLCFNVWTVFKREEEECTVPFFYQISSCSLIKTHQHSLDVIFSPHNFLRIFIKNTLLYLTVLKKGIKIPGPTFFGTTSKFFKIQSLLLWPSSHPYTRVCEKYSAVFCCCCCCFLRNPCDTLPNKPINIQKWMKTQPPWPR